MRLLNFAALRMQVEVEVAGMKTLAVEAEAGTSTAGWGAVEEAVDFWEVHNVAKKMKRVRSRYGDSSN